VFFYHGLVPKILWLSPIEEQLVVLHNTGIPSAILSPFAGVIEIIIALFIVLYRKSLVPVYIVVVSLIFLVVDVAWVMPSLLVEAFNPVTTNFMGLLLCYFIILTQGDVA